MPVLWTGTCSKWIMALPWVPVPALSLPQRPGPAHPFCSQMQLPMTRGHLSSNWLCALPSQVPGSLHGVGESVGPGQCCNLLPAYLCLQNQCLSQGLAGSGSTLPQPCGVMALRSQFWVGPTHHPALKCHSPAHLCLHLNLLAQH